MKKFYVLLIVFVCLLSTSAFAESDIYSVILNGEQQSYTAVMYEGELYFPKSMLPNDGTVLYKEVNGQSMLPQEELIDKAGYFILMDGAKHSVRLFDIKALAAKAKIKELNHRNKLPDLYGALEKTTTMPYSFMMDINGSVGVEYATPQLAEAFKLEHVFFSSMMEGYVNTAKELLEMTISFKLDAGAVMQERLSGLQIKVMDDGVYSFDPRTETWSLQALDDQASYELSAEFMQEDSNLYLWALSDYITETKTLNGQTYTATLTEKDLASIVDDVAGDGVYDLLMNEVKKLHYDINVTALKLSYVVRNGYLQSQHIEMGLDVMTTGIAAKMMIIMDSTYSDYGVERLMVKPTIVPMITQ